MQEDPSVVPIVLVDDSQEDLILTERVLRQCKILNPIRPFSTGDDCLRYFRGGPRPAPAETVKCLLLLDLVMPTSGLKVLQCLRQEGIGKNSVLVMLSGLTDVKTIHEGYQLGARTFLVKPIKPEDIVELLNSMQQKVCVEQTAQGYLLHWVPDPDAKPEHDTSYLKRTVALSI